MKMGIDWSEFPQELLEIIASKLTIYIDYVRFRAVCVKWRLFVSPTPLHLPTQLPWLMMPFGSPDGTQCSFFDISGNKLHLLDVAETRNSRCCGSSHGWLVLVEECSPEIRLLNPLTRNVIHLPPITTFPNVLDFNISNLGNEYLLQSLWNGPRFRRDLIDMRDLFIKKVVLSPSPNSLENDYIALAILGETWDLAFCKKGVEEWSIIEDARFYCEDVIYYNGAFYAVNNEGSIAICDLSGVSPTMTLITLPPIIGHHTVYLVDSFGELLLVTRFVGRVLDREPELVYKTVDFDVYKFDSSKPQWVPMESLGDHMLFLDVSSSVCLSGYDFSGCEGNRIYFISEATVGVDEYLDLGVYDLDNCSIVPLPYADDRSPYFLPPPIWVTPNPR